ncbi:hypothetical protein TWF696_001721 [Orbilia brochopaga]|uniref:Uncharacterized protein n=1 Tax=Orbilia brochopaga TaxID=3140254 RepID=A0AAV9U955_9PEZI
MDWDMPSVCLGINGRACQDGSLLPDTGITNAFVSSPDFPSGNPTADLTMTVDMPDRGHGMGRVQYRYGDTSNGVAGSVLPSEYKVRRTAAGGRVYVNVGSHFFNRFETAVDAEMGYYGIRDLM